MPVSKLCELGGEYDVYLAGAIEEAPDSGRQWREVVERQALFETTNPLDKFDPDDDQQWTAERIVKDNVDELRSSDAILVYDDGTRARGTWMELYEAYCMPIPICVVCDFPHEWDAERKRVTPSVQYYADYLRGSVYGGIAALELHFRRFGTTVNPSPDEGDRTRSGSVSDGESATDSPEDESVVFATSNVNLYDPDESIQAAVGGDN
jgi:hypothetical protein